MNFGECGHKKRAKQRGSLSQFSSAFNISVIVTFSKNLLTKNSVIINIRANKRKLMTILRNVTSRINMYPSWLMMFLSNKSRTIRVAGMAIIKAITKVEIIPYIYFLFISFLLYPIDFRIAIFFLFSAK